MRRGLAIAAGVLLACVAVWLVLSPRAPRPRGLTWLELIDAGSGRTIFAGALIYDEPIVLTWKNSLFRLLVTEVFAARAGRLELTQVTFSDPQGLPPPSARPEDLDDLYHTGGPFRVAGLSRPLTRAVFRVSEIGNPALAIAGRTIHFKQEVGFGGAVLMQARKPQLRLDGASLDEFGAYLHDLIGIGGGSDD
jgi:hypothetical protein